MIILRVVVYQVPALQLCTVLVALYILLQHSVVSMNLLDYNNQRHNYPNKKRQHMLSFYYNIGSLRELYMCVVI